MCGTPCAVRRTSTCRASGGTESDCATAAAGERARATNVRTRAERRRRDIDATPRAVDGHGEHPNYARHARPAGGISGPRVMRSTTEARRHRGGAHRRGAPARDDSLKAMTTEDTEDTEGAPLPRAGTVL